MEWPLSRVMVAIKILLPADDLSDVFWCTHRQVKQPQRLRQLQLLWQLLKLLIAKLKIFSESTIETSLLQLFIQNKNSFNKESESVGMHSGSEEGVYNN